MMHVLMLAVSLLVECESFDNVGGWVTDSASVRQMGSAYLMAHGYGRPVADATTSLEIPADGTYTVWARTRNWNAEWTKGAAGLFQVKVGDFVSRELGTGPKAWCGTDTLEKKDHRPPCANPREWYMRQLKDVAAFFKGLVDEETGERIPVILRYGHECDGSWFWWGRTWCTADEFRRFSRMTADYLRQECGDGQILFAYTPDRTWKDFGQEGDAGNTFLAYYPGDKYVDILGLDDYSIGHGSDEKAEKALAETLRKLRLMTAFADAHGQVAVVSETGGQKKRDDFWQYLHWLMTADGVKLAFVDTWGGSYGTIPDTPASEQDELTFARRPEVLMEGAVAT